MSVLESLRSGTDSTAMQVVMVLVIASFVLWVPFNGQDTGSSVAVVDGTMITDTDYQRLAGFLGNIQERVQDRPMDEAERKGFREKIVDLMVKNQVLLDEAHRLGLEVSADEMAARLLTPADEQPIDNGLINYLKLQALSSGADAKLAERWARMRAIEIMALETGEMELSLLAMSDLTTSDPEADVDGDGLDDRALDATIKRYRYTRSGWEDALREALLREKVRDLLAIGASISEPAIREYYINENTSLDLEFVRIRPRDFDAAVQIAPEDLATFATEQAARVDAAYQADYERLYNVPDKVHLAVIRLPVRADGLGVSDLKERLGKVRAELDAGADFGEMARRVSEEPSAGRGGDLGMQPVTMLTDEVAAHVATIADGAVGEALVGDAEVRLFKVVEREAGRVIPMEEVRDDIARRLLKEERAPGLAAKFAEDLRADWASSGTISEVMLGEHGLDVETEVAVRPDKEGGIGEPPKAMMRAYNRAEVGSVLPEVYEADGTYFVGRLEARNEADMYAYEDQKDSLYERVLAQRRQEFVTQWMASAVANAKIER